MKFASSLASLLAFTTATACGSAVRPPELVSAHTAYERASRGPAAALNPADLHVAKESLDEAAQSFEESGDTQVTRDLGYAETRRTETAESRARTLQVAAAEQQVEANTTAGLASQAKMTSAELAGANQALASRDQALLAQGAVLQTERERRVAAEKNLAQAALDLAKFATVKQETRGMVITLSGAVLFTSGKYELLPAAQLKLNEVAKALTEQDPESLMVVEGHTDSQGSEASNQELSNRRSESVRAYLVSRGVAADRITAQGFGQSRAIADNKTPDGRANNRRVEIVVKPKA
jgi:outer membrane protein OmpA-like peptidoglycan-associated protein